MTQISLAPWQRRLAYACIVAIGLTSACSGGGNTTTPPTTTVALSSLSLSAATVTAPAAVTGTVTLTAAAPAGGAAVTLSSSAAAGTVPASVTVPAGSTTATFSVATSGSGQVTITASFGGASRTASLMVNAGLAANFTVRSRVDASQSNRVVFPSGTADVCPIIASGADRTLACTFDGSASTGSPTRYIWRWFFANENETVDVTTATHQPAASTCGDLGGGARQDSGGIAFVLMTVELQVRDAQGNVSTVARNPNVRVIPQGNCGYGF